MKSRFGRLLAALAAATGGTLSLSAGEDLATSSAFHFRLNSAATDAPIILTTPAEADYFASANWPVAYRAGETVTATPPNGVGTTLVASAQAAGTVALALTSGGLWRLVNSSGETALVGVAWSVLGDDWSLGFDADSPFTMYTVGEGPDRKGKAYQFPAVAYSGDSWARDAGAVSTLTFVSPKGVETTRPLAGTGATPFKFSDPGLWHVALAMSDGSATREASIQVVGVGTTILVR